MEKRHGGAVALLGDGERRGGGQLEPGIAVYSNGTSYVSPLVEMFGDVSVGSGVFASNTVLRAAPGESLTLGDHTNSQDNVIVRALAGPTTVAARTSLAHHAVVRDCEVGEFVFLGFRAEVREAKIGNGAVVLHGARVLGVELPPSALVAAGATVDDAAAARSLPRVDEALVSFKEEVLEVNAEFARGYVKLAEEASYEELTITGPNPTTSFNRERSMPGLGAGIELADFARVVGAVRLGPNARVGERAALRVDEGTPIRATVGDGVQIGDGVVIAGPPEDAGKLDIPS